MNTQNSLEKSTADIDYYKVVYEGKNFNKAFEKLTKLYNGFIDELENGKYQTVEISDEIEQLELDRQDHLVTIHGRYNLYHGSELRTKPIVLMWHINDILRDINIITGENYKFYDTGVYGHYKGIIPNNDATKLRFASKSLVDLYDILVNLLGLLNEMAYKKRINGA